MGHSAVEIHSNRSLPQRQAAMAGFKNGKFRILVATDIAARGIDVNDISLVINYDLPDNKDDYVHRIGRTGRAGKIGKAISFAGPDERMAIRLIEKLIKKTIPIKPLPILPPKRAVVFTPRMITTNNINANSRRNNHGPKPFRSRTKKFHRY